MSPRHHCTPALAWRAYLDFADACFKKTGFRCNMPLGACFLRSGQNSMLSSSCNGDVFSIDPIHAVTEVTAWHTFLAAFPAFPNDWVGLAVGADVVTV